MDGNNFSMKRKLDFIDCMRKNSKFDSTSPSETKNQLAATQRYHHGLGVV